MYTINYDCGEHPIENEIPVKRLPSSYLSLSWHIALPACSSPYTYPSVDLSLSLYLSLSLPFSLPIPFPTYSFPYLSLYPPSTCLSPPLPLPYPAYPLPIPLLSIPSPSLSPTSPSLYLSLSLPITSPMYPFIPRFWLFACWKWIFPVLIFLDNARRIPAPIATCCSHV